MIEQLKNVQEDFMDFGFCEYLTVSPPRDLIVTNKMNSKITVFWTIQKHISMDDSFMAVFSVTPECASIKPNSSFLGPFIFKINDFL